MKKISDKFLIIRQKVTEACIACISCMKRRSNISGPPLCLRYKDNNLNCEFITPVNKRGPPNQRKSFESGFDNITTTPNIIFDNKLIDDFIKEAHTHDSEHSIFIFKIPFDQFSNLTCINKGGFSTIYKATWKYDHENEIDVVLKVIEDTKNMDSAFLNE
ncbi:7327_t:CDS:2, partial [Gigaspora rosea]